MSKELVEKLTDDWIEQWLLERLGKGNRFEQFNRQFCKDLLADATPIIQKAAEEHNSVAISEAYFRERNDGLTILKANVEEAKKAERARIFKQLEDYFPEAVFRIKAVITKEEWQALKGEVYRQTLHELLEIDPNEDGLKSPKGYGV